MLVCGFLRRSNDKGQTHEQKDSSKGKDIHLYMYETMIYWSG